MTKNELIVELVQTLWETATQELYRSDPDNPYIVAHNYTSGQELHIQMLEELGLAQNIDDCNYILLPEELENQNYLHRLEDD
jgi:hypothetical protein